MYSNLHTALQWVRFVDDVLGFSGIFCGSCIACALKLVYASELKMVHCTSPDTIGLPFEWTDLELRIMGWSVMWLPRNPNRQWLLGALTTDRPREAILPWAGRSPLGFARTRATLLGRTARARALHVPESLLTFVALEYLF